MHRKRFKLGVWEILMYLNIYDNCTKQCFTVKLILSLWENLSLTVFVHMHHSWHYAHYDSKQWKAKQGPGTRLPLMTEPYSPIPVSFFVSLQQSPMLSSCLCNWMQQAVTPSMAVTVRPTSVVRRARILITNRAIVHGGCLHSVRTRIEKAEKSG